MTEFLAGQFDIAVIGAGHAGIEAALAAARLGMETSSSPSIWMRWATCPATPLSAAPARAIWSGSWTPGWRNGEGRRRVLHPVPAAEQGKGPAVWSLRAQADRRRYQEYMKHTLEQQDHLTVRQGEVVEVRTENGAVSAVVLATGAVFSVKAVILATGTYLAGRTIVGECVEESGPDGMHAAGRLTDSLLKLGLPLRRSRPAPRPGSTPGAWTLTRWSSSRRRPAGPLFIRHPIPAGESGGLLAHLDHGGDAPDRPGESGPGACTPASSRGWAPATAPPLRPRWSGSRTSSATSCLWSPWASTPKNCTSRVSPPPCRRRCRSGCSAACRACAMP